jgi:hypothetical protein
MKILIWKLKGKWHFGATFIDNEGKTLLDHRHSWHGPHITRKLTLKNKKKSMDKKLVTPFTLRHGLRDQNHFCTRLRRDVSQLSINASFFQISIDQNLAEADVKFELVKFCYIFFILYVCKSDFGHVGHALR